MLHQAVQDERRFAQTAGNGLLMQAHRVFGGVGVERDAAAMQRVAEVRRQNIDGHIEPHAIRRARVAQPVQVTHRQMDGVVHQVHAGGLQRVRRQIPIRRFADLPDAEAGGRGHAGGADIAADGDQRRQHVAALNRRWQTPAADLQEVVEEVGLIVDVDQRVDEFDLGHPRLE
jgi:hypothetical protein